MDKQNKYSGLFNAEMSSEEARYVLYSHTDGLSAEDRDLLWQAYLPVSDAILQRELSKSEM